MLQIRKLQQSRNDAKIVKEKLATGVEAVADSAKTTKGKATKEIKKAKGKGSGFLSGIVKGAKHAVDSARGDVKEFLDETKHEAEIEEARAKKATAAGLKELEHKSDSIVAPAKDVKQETIADIKDTKHKVSKEASQVVDMTKSTVDKLTTETEKIGKEIELKDTDIVHDVNGAKSSLDKRIKEDAEALNKLLSNAEDSAKIAKSKLLEDTEKAKGTSSYLLSEVVEDTKHAGKKVSDDVKDFLETIRQEAATEETFAREAAAAKLKKLEETKDKATGEIKTIKDKTVKSTKNGKERILSGTKDARDKTTSAVRTAGKAGQDVSQVGDKIKFTGQDMTPKAKRAKDVATSQVKENTRTVKEKLATSTGTIADAASKDKTVKEAKKSKQKAGGFLSGMVKSAKHAVEGATDDMKEFLEETKQEATAEEARTKNDIAQMKDKSSRLVTDTKEKSVGAIKDTKKKITQKMSKSSKGAHAVPVSSGADEVAKTLATETRKLGEKVGSEVAEERVQEVVLRSEVAGKPELSGDIEHLTESVRVKRVSRIPQKISPGKETASDVTLDDSSSHRVVEMVSTTVGHPEPRTRHSVTTVVTKSSVQTTPPPPSSLAEFTDSRTEGILQ